MVEMFEQQLAGIEVIHAVPGGMRDRPLPTVLFYHGYTSSKEVYSYFGYALAKAGFRVIMPDADMHGARYDGDENRRLAHFWDILKSNIDEMPLLRSKLQQLGLIDQQRLGVCGASMGGMTTLGGLARYPWIAAAADFMGSGYFMSLSKTLFPPLQVTRAGQRTEFERRLAPLAEYDISHQLDRLADRPLLIWHGEADEVVPAAESARLYQALRSRGLTANLSYLTEPQIGHKITVSALAAGVAFFQRHL